MDNLEPEINYKKILFNVISSTMALLILLAGLFYFAVKMPGESLQRTLSPISIEQSSLSKLQIIFNNSLNHLVIYQQIESLVMKISEMLKWIYMDVRKEMK